MSEEPIEELVGEGQEEESANENSDARKKVKEAIDSEDDMARTPDVINLSELTANEEEQKSKKKAASNK